MPPRLRSQGFPLKGGLSASWPCLSPVLGPGGVTASPEPGPAHARGTGCRGDARLGPLSTSVGGGDAGASPALVTPPHPPPPPASASSVSACRPRSGWRGPGTRVPPSLLEIGSVEMRSLKDLDMSHSALG